MPSVPDISVVLEEDGTEIDEDDILLELGGQTLMLLAPRELWAPPSAASTTTCSSPTPPPPPQMSAETSQALPVSPTPAPMASSPEPQPPSATSGSIARYSGTVHALLSDI